MPQRSSYEPGTPCWVDLSTGDVGASTAFYAGLFGWAADPMLDPDGNHIYTMLTKDGLKVGGLGGQPPGAEAGPPFWSTYISVTDAEHTCALIEKAGGQVVMPVMQVFDAGHMAVAVDPTGADFRIWQPLEHGGSEIVNEADTWAWNELFSSDVERSKQFYSDVFGWTYNGMEMGAGGTYWVIEGGECGGRGGLMEHCEMVPAECPDAWSVYFMVSDIEATMAAVGDLGGSVLHGPEALPGIGLVIGTLKHPAGGVFSLMQPPSSPEHG
jgi:predicted enzyme related to lactoylglutathione lyase